MQEPKEKILIIYDSISDLMPFIEGKGYLIYNTFRPINFFFKVIRKICIKCNFPLTLWFGGWKDKLNDGQTVILFSTKFPQPIRYIRTRNFNIRTILWYWNPVAKSIDPNIFGDLECEKWSFDKEDCNKFKLKNNTTFYLNNIALPRKKTVYDSVFVGVDKNRKRGLISLKETMETAGLQPYFYIVDDFAAKRGYRGDNRPISYNSYLNLVAQSKSILDFIQDGQSGLTLRVMESIFFEKKLITNNREIINAEFYKSNNIFILEIDPLDKLVDFINTPYSPVDRNLVERYDFNHWISRFF